MDGGKGVLPPHNSGALPAHEHLPHPGGALAQEEVPVPYSGEGDVIAFQQLHGFVQEGQGLLRAGGGGLAVFADQGVGAFCQGGEEGDWVGGAGGEGAE